MKTEKDKLKEVEKEIKGRYENEIDKYISENSVLRKNLKRKDTTIKKLENQREQWKIIARAEFKKIWDKLEELGKNISPCQEFSSLKEAGEFVNKNSSALDKFIAITLRASDLKLLFDKSKIKEIKG